MRRRVFVAVWALVLAAAGGLNAQVRIQVAIREPVGPDGWVRPELQDTAKDLAKVIASPRRKVIMLATSEAKAHLVIELVERHMEDAGEIHVVTAKVKAGDSDHLFIGQSDSNWRDAATSLAKQIDKWAEANRARILASRTR